MASLLLATPALRQELSSRPRSIESEVDTDEDMEEATSIEEDGLVH